MTVFLWVSFGVAQRRFCRADCGATSDQIKFAPNRCTQFSACALYSSPFVGQVRHCTTDAQGLEITVVNSPNGQVALDQFNIAVDQFANFSASPIQALDKALAADPDFFMGHFLKVSNGCSLLSLFLCLCFLSAYLTACLFLHRSVSVRLCTVNLQMNQTGSETGGYKSLEMTTKKACYSPEGPHGHRESSARERTGLGVRGEVPDAPPKYPNRQIPCVNQRSGSYQSRRGKGCKWGTKFRPRERRASSAEEMEQSRHSTKLREGRGKARAHVKFLFRDFM